MDVSKANGRYVSIHTLRILRPPHAVFEHSRANECPLTRQRGWLTTPLISEVLNRPSLLTNLARSKQDNIRTVLIVEDDDSLMQGCQILIEDLGLSTCASKGDNVGAMIETFDPDLILLDIALGVTDAFMVIRSQIPPTCRAIVSIMSGLGLEFTTDAMVFAERMGLNVGVPLLKPFSNRDLLDAIEAADELLQRKSIVEASKREDSTSCSAVPLRLREALNKQLLEFWYHPKFDLSGHNVTGAEVLVRARRPNGHVVLPYELLHEATQADMLELTDRLLCGVVQHVETLRASGFRYPLSINIPISYLLKYDPVRHVRQAAMKPGWPGLIFELTEDEALGEPEELQLVATQLKLYGISLSIDDFGAAYSSLARLRDVPFKELKLDRSFVRGCAQDSTKRSICRSVMMLAGELGVHTVAEGVENWADLEVISELGFDQIQGFLFAKPMPFADFKALVARSSQLAIEHVV